MTEAGKNLRSAAAAEAVMQAGDLPVRHGKDKVLYRRITDKRKEG